MTAAAPPVSRQASAPPATLEAGSAQVTAAQCVHCCKACATTASAHHIVLVSVNLPMAMPAAVLVARLSI